MTFAYFGYRNPMPDSTDLTVQRPNFGTNVTFISFWLSVFLFQISIFPFFSLSLNFCIPGFLSFSLTSIFIFLSFLFLSFLFLSFLNFSFSLFPFSLFPFSLFPFSLFPFSLFPFSLFPFSLFLSNSVSL